MEGPQWLTGGGKGRQGGDGRQDPLPPGQVVSDRDKILSVVEVLKTLLGSEVGSSMDELLKDRLPPEPVPAPPKSPTEQERARKYGQLLDQEMRLKEGFVDGRGRLDRAKEKVRQEEERLEKAERELRGVEEQIEAFRAESREKENKRMAVARSAWGPSIEEVASDMDVEGEEGGGGWEMMLGKASSLRLERKGREGWLIGGWRRGVTEYD